MIGTCRISASDSVDETGSCAIGSNSTSRVNSSGRRCAAISNAAPPIECPNPTSPPSGAIASAAATTSSPKCDQSMRPVRHGGGLAVTVEVEAEAAVAIGERPCDRHVAVGVEAGGVRDQQRRQVVATGQLVDRDRDAVVRRDVEHRGERVQPSSACLRLRARRHCHVPSRSSTTPAMTEIPITVHTGQVPSIHR